MDSLRRRVPFKLADEGEEGPNVLDEQEQEEVLENLRRANMASNAQYHILIQAVLSLSMLAQLVYLFTPSKRTPLANIFPVTAGSSDAPLPLSTILTITSIGVHLNLLLLSRSPLVHLLDIGNQLDLKPLPFDLTYAISAVGPALSLFTQKPWQTTVWWCLNPFIVFVTKTVLEAMENGNNIVAELEGMKYTSPGA